MPGATGRNGVRARRLNGAPAAVQPRQRCGNSARLCVAPRRTTNGGAACAQVLAFYVKLGALLVKQISKPLASVLKSQAVAHPSLREVLTRVGQRMHEYNLRITQQLKSDGEIATGRKARAPPRPVLARRGGLGRDPGRCGGHRPLR